ncbi:YcgN family cysteine cluster protein [Endozoicomonas sp. Mp262]|uniref:YcgN family cysteine cluster protein n=1 Tax=Endozoicomonas sp. Mp262 TaxID=2919499 RepID=UPI0021D9A90A
MDNPFWQKKPLHAMSHEEWESLCDGCGKCCLHKLEDEDSGDVYYTTVACQLLDIPSCQCKDYDNRKKKVPGCIKLTVDDIAHFHWLPETCAYRLLAEGQSLPDWHPLISGCQSSVHKAGLSVKDYAHPEQDIPESEWEDYIIPVEQL